jgi:hypothetical protein
MSIPEKEIGRNAQAYQQPDMSISKIISDWLFQPANRFDPVGRMRAKPEILIFSAIYA